MHNFWVGNLFSQKSVFGKTDFCQNPKKTHLAKIHNSNKSDKLENRLYISIDEN